MKNSTGFPIEEHLKEEIDQELREVRKMHAFHAVSYNWLAICDAFNKTQFRRRTFHVPNSMQIMST